MYMCIFTENIFFLREQVELWPENLFRATCVKPFSMNDKKSVQSVIFLTVNIKMLQECDNYQSIMCIRLLLICKCDYLSLCPSLMHGIAICYVQHCQATLERGLCELHHYFFHGIKNICTIRIRI